MGRSRAEVKQSPIHATMYLLILVVLAGFLWRFIGLGKESIWLDEATSLIIARMDLRSEMAWAAADIHPPLYYFVLHGWLLAGETEYALRALSALFGVFAIAILYALARRLFGPGIGLLSALFLALSPLHIWYSQEARMYAMVATLSLLSSYFLLLAIRTEQVHYWFSYVLTSVLALYTHYFMFFVLLFQNLFIFYRFWRKNWTKLLWYKWLIAELAIALLFLPWLPVLYQQANVRSDDWILKSIERPSLYALINTWFRFNIGIDGRLYPLFLRRLAYVLFGISVAMALAMLFQICKEDGRRGTNHTNCCEGLVFCLLYSAMPLLTIWLFSQISPVYAIRYLSPFLPPYYIIVANGIHALKKSWIQTLMVICLVAILLVGNWNAWRIEQGDDWRGISAYVLTEAQPGDIVLFSPRWNAKPFDYYANGRVAINIDLPIPVTREAAQETIANIAQRYTRVWFIWQRSHYSDPTGIVKQSLDNQFQLIATREFRNEIEVSLYDLEARTAWIGRQWLRISLG